MKIEEAIEWMEETIQDINELFDQCSTALQEEITEQKEVFELAFTALRSMQEVGEPLTVEKLREVPHGKIKDGTLQNISNRANEIASPPAHIDRSEWISVKERLPKDFDQALVYDGDEHYPIGICHKGESGIWHSDMAYGMGTITHWMPLPEPPEEG